MYAVLARPYARALHAVTCRACSSGRIAAVKALVEAGKTPLGIRDKQGATPLYVAASTDQQQICLYLLSKGADVEVRPLLCLTAAQLPVPVYLYHAASKGACATQQSPGFTFLAHGDILWEMITYVKYVTGRSHYHRAVQLHWPGTVARIAHPPDCTHQVVQGFSRGRVYVQAEDKEGETPLSVAATKGLRQLLVDVATGKTSADELMEDL